MLSKSMSSFAMKLHSELLIKISPAASFKNSGLGAKGCKTMYWVHHCNCSQLLVIFLGRKDIMSFTKNLSATGSGSPA